MPGLVTALKRLFQAILHWRTMRGPAGLFDPDYYRAEYPQASRIGPWLHFIVAGAYQGCNPHPLFDTAFYLEKYPDVRQSGINPLLHYMLHGAAEGRKPHPWFEPAYYLSRCPEARGTNPLAHFLRSTGADCRSPHPLFDCEAYLRSRPELAGRDVNPLAHFLRFDRGVSAATEGSQFGCAS